MCLSRKMTEIQHDPFRWVDCVSVGVGIGVGVGVGVGVSVCVGVKGNA